MNHYPLSKSPSPVYKSRQDNFLMHVLKLDLDSKSDMTPDESHLAIKMSVGSKLCHQVACDFSWGCRTWRRFNRADTESFVKFALVPSLFFVCKLLGYVSRAFRPSVSWSYAKRTNPMSWKTKTFMLQARPMHELVKEYKLPCYFCILWSGWASLQPGVTERKLRGLWGGCDGAFHFFHQVLGWSSCSRSPTNRHTVVLTLMVWFHRTPCCTWSSCWFT